MRQLAETMLFTKLNVRQVKAKINKLGEGEELTIWLCPSKCYPSPFHPFNLAIDIKITNQGVYDPELEEYSSLESVVSNFAYYNCTHETGIRTHYYLEGKNAR
jgi:hypothetical protein